MRAILFDLDGTLVDSLPGIAFSVDEALAHCGLPQRTRDLRPLIGPPIRTILSQLLAESDECRLSDLEWAFRQSYDNDGWSKTVLADSAVQTLEAFRNAGLPLFVVTNKPSRPTNQILERLGIRRLFADVLCRDSRNPAFRSKAEMLQHILEVHRLEPGNCLYVGDTAEDYRASQQVAVPVAIVSDGYGEAGAVHGDCIKVSKLTELLTTLELMEMS